MSGNDEALDHRAIGADLFNRTWELIGKQHRTVEEDDAMLHMAHASAHHWRAEGAGATANNLARSEWQVRRRRLRCCGSHMTHVTPVEGRAARAPALT